ncbi:MAG: CheR family methyltransferase, partial [Rhabdochlamydiaceae bacterium]
MPGCSTGEEAYSIAICLIEYLTERALSIPVQIFATDLNEAAIDQARSAVYLKSAMEDISVERLNRFFVPINGRYQVIKPVRDICIFARHNLLKDPPFSHLDIISCHNVLIYLKPEAQGKILQSFHYGLNQEGYLLLGKSETAGSTDHFFEPVDKEHKIYIKKSATLGSYDFSLHTSYRERTPMATSKREVKENIIDVEKQTDKVLQDYLPPSVLVNQDLNIIGFRGDTSPYLRPAAGKASFHLMKMIREELVFELRTVINQAKSEAKKVKKEKIIYDREGHTRVVSLEVAPIIASAKERYYLIIFKEGTPAAVAEKISGGSKDKEITALKQQLK